MNALLSPRMQLRLAWVVMVAAMVGWPASALTIFSNEPQGILGLSWLAIILSAYNTIVTTEVNETTAEEKSNG